MKNKPEPTLPPLVSFVTVTYNSCNEAIDTVESVKRQGVSHQHIVVDGGSPKDQVAMMAASLTENDTLISEKDEGIYDAMNKGLRLALGKYVVIINSGDLLRDLYVREAVEVLEGNPAIDIVYGGVVGKVARASADKTFYIYHFNINHQSFVSRRECYRDVGLLSRGCLISSDIQWTRDCIRHGKAFHYLGPNILHFASGGASSSPALRELIISENCRLLSASYPFLAEHEAKAIYQARFSPAHLGDILAICKRHASDRPEFKNSLKAYIIHLLLNEKTYTDFSFTEVSGIVKKLIETCEILNIPLSTLVNLRLSQVTKQALVAVERIAGGEPYIVHYVSVYGRKTETFIRELIDSLANNPAHSFRQVVLCDEIETEYQPKQSEIIVRLPYTYVGRFERDFIYGKLFRNAHGCIIQFALNSYKLMARLQSIASHVRFVHMLHGIDVFKLFDERSAEYSALIRQISKLRNHAFIAPSEYLKAKAVEAGVSRDKIRVIPNSYRKAIYEITHKRPKRHDLCAAKGKLKILSVGRMIPWKGHGVLAEALMYTAKERTGLEIEWTNLSGGVADTREQVQAIINDSGQLNLSFQSIDFVDLDKVPSFFLNYDLFIQPSQYDLNSPGMPTESFGVAVLEAIVCGLPVVVSDAGGIPEIICCADKVQVCEAYRLFKAGSPISLHAEISFLLDNSLPDSHQAAREAVISYFDPVKRDSDLINYLESIPSNSPKIAILSAQVAGGAGGATHRLWKSLKASGLDCNLLVKGDRRGGKMFEKQDDYLFVSKSVHDGTQDLAANTPNQYRARDSHTIFSVDEQHLSASQLAHIVRNYDIVNIHWTARFISAKDIEILSKCGIPIVITVRDMQHMAGGCHYFHGCSSLEDFCACCPQFMHISQQYANKTITDKVLRYNHGNIHYVYISELSYRQLSSSPLPSKAASQHIIPNGFHPLDAMPPRIESKEDYLRILTKGDVSAKPKKTFLFVPSFDSSVKGSRVAFDALHILPREAMSCIRLILISYNRECLRQVPPSIETHLINFMGRDDLLGLYAAVDFVLVPSLEETFSNTCAESMLCGTPVIGSPAGAIPQMIVPGLTGEIAADHTPSELAAAIMRGVYSTYDATKCRRHILDNFSQFKTVLRYKKLFEALFIGKKSTHSEPTDRLSHVDFLSENFSTFSPFPVRPKNIGSSLEAVSDGRLVDINKPLKDRLNGNLLFFDMLRCELVLYRCKSNYSLVLVADLNLYGVSHWGVFNGKISILPERGEKAWVSVLALVESPADCTSFYYMLKDQSIIARKKNGNEIAFTATLAGVTV